MTPAGPTCSHVSQMLPSSLSLPHKQLLNLIQMLEDSSLIRTKHEGSRILRAESPPVSRQAPS